MFNDWFTTVPLPENHEFSPKLWEKLFGESCYQYVFADDEEEDGFPIKVGDTFDADNLATQDRVEAVQEELAPASSLPMLLPVASMPSDANLSPSDCVGSVPSPMSNAGNPDMSLSFSQSPSHLTQVQWSLDTELGVVSPKAMSHPAKLLKCTSPSCPSPSPPPAPVPCHPRESPVWGPASSSFSLIVPETPYSSPSVTGTPFTPPLMSHWRESFTKSGPRNPDVTHKPPPALTSQGIVTCSGHDLGSTRQVTCLSTVTLPPRVLRFGYNGTQGHGYVTVPNGTKVEWVTHITSPQANMLSHFEHHLIPSLFLDSGFASLAAYRAAVKDPDILTYDEAMNNVKHLAEWKAAMHKEMSQLEALKCWDEVDISDAKTKIIPGTWVFKIKCSPDGEIKKYKVRFCCRGDLQEDVFKSFTPVVSWT